MFKLTSQETENEDREAARQKVRGTRRTLDFTLSKMGSQWRSLSIRGTHFQRPTLAAVESRLQEGQVGRWRCGQKAAVIRPVRADGGVALGGGSGQKWSEFEHILKEPLAGFPDGLEVGHESEKQSALPSSFFP